MAPPGRSCCGSRSRRKSAARRGSPTSLAARRDSASRPGPLPGQPAPCTRRGDRPLLLFAPPLAASPSRVCLHLPIKFSPAHLLCCRSARGALSVFPRFPKSPIPGPASPTQVTLPPAPGPSFPRRSLLSWKQPAGARLWAEPWFLSRTRAPLPVSLGLRRLQAPVSLLNKNREGVGRELKPFAIGEQPQPKITLERRAENGYLLPALKSEAGRCVCVCVCVCVVCVCTLPPRPFVEGNHHCQASIQQDP
ncbi:hypothetical protein AAY473_022693 [Plecturocebus cupreus]